MNTPKTLTLFECCQLLDALLVKKGTEKQFRKSIRNYTMALLMLDAGLRVGEVVQLQWDHLYFYNEPTESILLTASITKNKQERTVPAGGRIRNAAAEMYKYWWSADGLAPSVYAFYQTDPYKPITTRQVERIIRAAAMKSIGRPVHPHVLRHTFASKLMRKANARIVQELLGHQSMTSTQIYTHPNEDDKKKAIQDIEKDNVQGVFELKDSPESASLPNDLDAGSTDRDV